MAICGAISKYGINNFTLYILEIVDLSINTDILSKNQLLSNRENYWFELILPSYNIQSILKPFSEYNHYRFGKSLYAEVKSKISKSLLGRTLSEEVKLNHSLGARKKKVFCFDWEIDSFLMEFSGIRVMARGIGIRHEYIRAKIEKEKPLFFFLN
jgi:hypothetical protein